MVEFTGMNIQSIAHPEDVKAYQSLNNSKVIHSLLNWIADKQNDYILKTAVMGNCFKVTDRDMPKLFSLLSEVCNTLDFKPLPNIYLAHSSEFEIDVYAGEKPLVIIPDYLLSDFDDDMLRFSFGRAITNLKSEHCQLKMLSRMAISSSLMLPSIPGLNEVVFYSLYDWARKACFTEDRGGLLACQNILSSERVLMRITGLPLNYLDSTCILEYIEDSGKKNVLATASQYMKTLSRMKPWNNDRIVQLYKWYKSGEYDDLLDVYE